MATTENYGFWYLDPDEEISDFPNQWDYNIDKIDEAIHNASATDDVAASRITGTLAAARIPGLAASKTTSGRFPEARMPQAILDRLDELEDKPRSTGPRNITGEIDGGDVVGGALVICRVGNTVTVIISQIKFESGSGGWQRLLYLPTGFRPPYDCRENLIGADNGHQVAIYKSGNISLNMHENYTYRNTITYVTEGDWPSSLPGDPA